MNEDSLIDKLLNWLRNSNLQAAVAENPSVMIAVGYRINKDGTVTQERTDNRLANNLATIGEAAIAAPTLVSDLNVILNAVKHPIKNGKQIINNFRNIKEYSRINNSNNDLNYHLERLNNGGFDKIKDHIVKSSPENVKVFETSIDNFSEVDKAYQEYLKQFSLKDTSENKQNFWNIYSWIHADESGTNVGSMILKHPKASNTVLSHELDHAIHYPKESPKGFKTNNSYFTQNNGTELSARGTQIKDYFRITDPNQEITAEQLKYASQHYIQDTGINNQMDEFFNSIVDWEKAAKWISDNSTVISIPFITTGDFWGNQKPVFNSRKQYYNK